MKTCNLCKKKEVMFPFMKGILQGSGKKTAQVPLNPSLLEHRGFIACEGRGTC